MVEFPSLTASCESRIWIRFLLGKTTVIGSTPFPQRIPTFSLQPTLNSLLRGHRAGRPPRFPSLSFTLSPTPSNLLYVRSGSLLTSRAQLACSHERATAPVSSCAGVPPSPCALISGLQGKLFNRVMASRCCFKGWFRFDLGFATRCFELQQLGL